jgi:excisionase family DNA binding protein
MREAAPDLAVLLVDPMRAAEVPADQVPALLAQVAAEQARLAAVQAALAARLGGTHNGTPNDADRWLSVAEVAERTGFSVDYLYRHAGKFPFTRRQGRSLRFSEAGLARWMARQSR